VVEGFFYDIGTWLEAAGGWAYALAPLITATVAILPIPAEFPALLNGMLFGTAVGTLISWSGALAGAQISFELARRLGRPLAERFIKPESLAKADDVVMKGGWWGMLLPRFIPLIAFTALNWGAGLTSVPRWRFFWTTAVGILPGALVFTASGAGLPWLLERFPVATWVIAIALLAYGIYCVMRGSTQKKKVIEA
jgi:uncharacterized membrane protein YdjX (TVP38/TMEM64 family)